jgi:hypothetical protein
MHKDRIDVVRLVLPVDEEHRWVLRLWPTNLSTSEKDLPIFEGTIEVQNRRRLGNIIFLAKDSGKYDVPLKRLTEVLPGRFAVKLVNRQGEGVVPEKESRKMDWHGGVLLIYEKETAL